MFTYLKQCLQWIRTLVSKFEFTCGTLLAVFISVILFCVSKCLNLSPHVFTLGASVVVNGHVHKLLTYPFINEDVPRLLLSASVLLLFCSSLEKSLGTVRLMYLQLLLCMCTGLMHTLLELLLFSVAEQNHVQGFIPVSLALLGMATVHSPMRKAVLLGISVPTPALPWILLLFTLIIPDSVFLCNAVAILLGEIYGMGWFSLLDLSEARASVLDKKMPFRQLRMLVGALYIPASIEERRKTQDQPFNPPPGSYPVQAYAPAVSVPSRPLTDGLPQMYEGWQHSTYMPGSFPPPLSNHGHSHGHSAHGQGQDRSHERSAYGHSQDHGHGHSAYGRSQDHSHGHSAYGHSQDHSHGHSAYGHSQDHSHGHSAYGHSHDHSHGHSAYGHSQDHSAYGHSQDHSHGHSAYGHSQDHSHGLSAYGHSQDHSHGLSAYVHSQDHSDEHSAHGHSQDHSHGHSAYGHCVHGHSQDHSHGHSDAHGYSHGQMIGHPSSSCRTQGAPSGQPCPSPSGSYPVLAGGNFPAATPSSG